MIPNQCAFEQTNSLVRIRNLFFFFLTFFLFFYIAIVFCTRCIQKSRFISSINAKFSMGLKLSIYSLVPSLHCFDPKFVYTPFSNPRACSESFFRSVTRGNCNLPIQPHSAHEKPLLLKSLAFFGFPIEFLQNKQCNLYMQVPLFLARTGMCTPMRTCVL